jgi:hypothetical protein
MCSSHGYDDPTTYSAPEVTAPRRYVLSGAPLCSSCGVPIAEHPDVQLCEPRGSVALAVIGELIQQAEDREWVYSADALTVLHEARIRIAAAEAAL